jgi:hypothetical protein
MPAKSSLRDLTLRCPRKRHTHVLQLDDSSWSVIAHYLYRVLIAEVVGTFYRVESVPLRIILFQIAERRTNSALRRASMRAQRMHFRQHRARELTANFHRRPQPRAAGSYYYYVELMCHEFLIPIT